MLHTSVKLPLQHRSHLAAVTLDRRNLRHQGCRRAARTRGVRGTASKPRGRCLGTAQPSAVLLEKAPPPRKSASAAVNSTKGKASQYKQFGFLPNFQDKFEVGKVLGAGAYGVVNVAVDKETKIRYAVKTIPKVFVGEYLEEHLVQRVQHEVDVAKHLASSLNVVYMYGAYEDDACVKLVMELCTGGVLWSRIKQGRYSEKEAARLLREMLRAVALCHARGVIVRDVKPENFLLSDRSDSAHLKMIDFGLATYCSPGQVLTRPAGTMYYMAPEVLKSSYGLPSDIWSVGVVAYHLLSGRSPWVPARSDDGDGASNMYFLPAMAPPNLNKDQLHDAIINRPLDFSSWPWNLVSDAAKDCVASMLLRDPGQRPTAQQLLDHPWLREEENCAADHPLSDTLIQRLQRFGTYGKLKQAALRALAPLIANDTREEVVSLQEQFNSLDKNQDGKISYRRLLTLLQAYNLSQEEREQLAAQFRLDLDGRLDYHDWLAALIDWGEAQESTQWNLWVRKVFELFDVDGCGAITAGDLQDVLHVYSSASASPNLYYTPDDVNAALREADLDGNGNIDYDEFARLLQTSDAEGLDLFESRRPTGSDSNFLGRLVMGLLEKIGLIKRPSA